MSKILSSLGAASALAVLACGLACGLACCANKEPVNTVTPASATPTEPASPAPPAVPQGVDVPQAPAKIAPAPSAVPAVEPIASAKPARGASTAPAVEPRESAKTPRSDEPARPSKPKPAPAAPEPPPAPPPPPPPPSAPPAVEPPAPAPAAPAPEPPVKKNMVTVPHTDHVKVDVPAGMQALLDADPRMQKWVDKVIAVADRCYQSKGGDASATIVVDVTMHKDARPDADIRSLPPSLAGVVACGTGDLMRTKMPLFCGPEGEHHTLKIKFKP